jgi:hypothetical protein
LAENTHSKVILVLNYLYTAWIWLFLFQSSHLHRQKLVIHGGCPESNAPYSFLSKYSYIWELYTMKSHGLIPYPIFPHSLHPLLQPFINTECALSVPCHVLLTQTSSLC